MVERNSLGYLAHMILEIIEARKPAQGSRHVNGLNWLVYTLGGGAELWWHKGSSQLMALRPNARLQNGEAKTFESNIRAAGYTHGKAADVMVGGNPNDWTALNSYHGVTWKISPAKPEPTEPAATQESLF